MSTSTPTHGKAASTTAMQVMMSMCVSVAVIPSGGVASAGERAGAGTRGTTPSIARPIIIMGTLATMAAGTVAIMIPITTATPVATMEGTTVHAMADGTMATMTAIMEATILDTGTVMLLGLLRVPTTSTITTIPTHTAHAPRHVAQVATLPTPASVTKAISALLAPMTKKAARSPARSTMTMLAPTKADAPHSSATMTSIPSAAMTKALPARPTIPTRAVVADTQHLLVVVSAHTDTGE